MSNYFYSKHSLSTPNHTFMTFGYPEAVTPTTIFENCGVKTSSGEQELYTQTVDMELPYERNEFYQFRKNKCDLSYRPSNAPLL